MASPRGDEGWRDDLLDMVGRGLRKPAALATVLAAESGLKVVGSDLYPERYTEAAALYAHHLSGGRRADAARPA